MPECRIYQPTKSAMQAGRAKTKKWLLEFEPTERIDIDPLVGWAGSKDTARQVKLHFNSREDAIAFAEKENFSIKLQEPQQRVIRPKNYSDNFSSRFRYR